MGKQTGSWWGGSSAQCAIVLGCLLLTSSAWFLTSRSWGSGGTDTLVIYIFSNTNPQYIKNLNYFLREAVKYNDGAEYLIVLQGGNNDYKLPQLPPNAKFVSHENRCFDLGTVGWVLFQSGLVNVKHYKYIMWLNSSVRGPFVPNYIRGHISWHRVLTDLIDDTVKLVGSTISCSPTQHPEVGEVLHPHIQSYLLATDQDGLEVLRANPNIFTCHATWQDAVLLGELSASKTMLEAGFNLGSLMMRYYGVDWRDTANWHCNAQQNPLNKGSYDGISVNPLEVMFVKVKQMFLETGWPHVRQAVKYDEWTRHSHPPPNMPPVGDFRNISSNQYLQDLPQRLAVLRKHGIECFDANFYRATSPYEFRGRKPKDLWDHFIVFGFKEGRPYRMTC